MRAGRQFPGRPSGLEGRATSSGSPYCVRDYVVDDHLGGPTASPIARAALAARRRPDPRLRAEPCGARPSVDDRATRAVRPGHRRAAGRPDVVHRGRRQVLANGRDPFFPAWPDVVQLNAFAPECERRWSTPAGIADQCDGVRCDMAMLVMNDVFSRTWGERAGPRPTDGLLADGDPGGARDPPRLPLPRRGLLGPRVGTAATGLRLLLRQAAVRPPVARRPSSVRRTCSPTTPTRAWSGSSRTMTSRGPRGVRREQGKASPWRR